MSDDDKTTVLLVDDQPIIGESVRRIFVGEADIAFHHCADPQKALDVARTVAPTVMLIDLLMPGISGLELVRQFRAHPATEHVPIIVLSMQEEPEVKAESFRMGANDYLVKLPSPVELIARVRYHSTAYINACRSRSMYEALRESREQLQQRNDEIRRQRDTLATQARELTLVNTELADANNVKTYFAATMSHELRNVFTVMNGYSEILCDKGQRGEPFDIEDFDMLAQLNRRGQEGLDVITITLEMSRSEIKGTTQDLHEFDLRPMLQELTTELPAAHSKHGIEVVWSVADDLRAIHSDPIKLKMVLVNLLTNALKYSAADGRIELRATRDGTDVEILVSDTGAGIPPESLPTLFDPFQQAHGIRSRRIGGAGLGLYVVRRLVEILDGTISVTSTVDVGSTFRILLRGAATER